MDDPVIVDVDLTDDVVRVPDDIIESLARCILSEMLTLHIAESICNPTHNQKDIEE